MIELFDNKKKCCGCGACMNACPQSAIRMKKDEYGFVYPVIDSKYCIECGICKKTCAFQKQTVSNKPKRILAISGKNDSLIKKSASGGLFATMASFVLEQGGCVYGAVMQHENHELHIRHICCETQKELEYLQGSKYVQSSMEKIFKDVKEKLKHGKLVLFSGTPCQVDALKSYLKIDYEKLLVVDIICHGVPNEQFFDDYIHYLGKKIGGEILDFKFRDKSMGWGLNAKADYVKPNGQKAEYNVSYLDSSYYDLFLNAKIYRENCYHCHYAAKKRVGDITIGDYWGIEDQHPEALLKNGGGLSEQSGISVMLLNTEKGKHFFDGIKNNFIYYESTFEKAAKRNTQLVHPVQYTKARNQILFLYKKWGYKAVEFYFGCSMQKRKFSNLLRRFVPNAVKYRVKKILH